MATALSDNGLAVLRNQGVAIERGGERLYVAGVDDTWTGRDDLEQTLARPPRGRCPRCCWPTIRRCFPSAAARGVRAHACRATRTAGSWAFPFFARRWNLARVMTRFASGFYREGASTLYVNHGLGHHGHPHPGGSSRRRSPC